jgi:hypothetical protein
LFSPQREEGLKWGIVLLVNQNLSTRTHAERPRKSCVKLSEKKGSNVESPSDLWPSKEIALYG